MKTFIKGTLGGGFLCILAGFGGNPILAIVGLFWMLVGLVLVAVNSAKNKGK